jgi:hypothetical protein
MLFIWDSDGNWPACAQAKPVVTLLHTTHATRQHQILAYWYNKAGRQFSIRDAVHRGHHGDRFPRIPLLPAS